jgi:hypothetical protein
MLKNINLFEKQLDNIASNIANEYVWRCGQAVRKEAWDLCPKDHGQLADSLNVVQLEPNSVGVGTNVEYAVYVHEGTGMYAKPGVPTSRPRGTYWIYIKTPGSDYSAYKQSNPGQSKTYLTLEDAKRAMAILQSKGLDAHISNGEPSRPFLTQALQNTEPLFDGILEEVMKEAVK